MGKLPLAVDIVQDTAHLADSLFVGTVAGLHLISEGLEVAYNLVAVGDQNYSYVAVPDLVADCVPEVYPAGSATSINKNIVGDKTICDM